MNYSNFLESLNENKIHVLDLNDSRPYSDLALSLHEPCYVVGTSGTQNKKYYLHKLSCLVHASDCVISHYNLGPEDRWLQTLPSHHIGGFSIGVRSWRGKLRAPLETNWSVKDLSHNILEENITLLSLVPTQIFDLVSNEITPPSCVRHVFVGGAAISSELKASAIKLGWPLRMTYGLTESAAQMAYESDDGVFLPYKGWEFKISEDSSLCVKGPGLFFGEIRLNDSLEFRPRSEGEFFRTSDKASSFGNGFKNLRRSDEKIKLKGSFIDFENLTARLEAKLLKQGLKPTQFQLVAMSDLRAGAKIFLLSEIKNLTADDFKDLNVDGIFYLSSIPRTELGKFRKHEAERLLGKKILS